MCRWRASGAHCQQPQALAQPIKAGESIHLQRGAPLAGSGGSRTSSANGGRQQSSAYAVDDLAGAMAAPAAAATFNYRSRGASLDDGQAAIHPSGPDAPKVHEHQDAGQLAGRRRPAPGAHRQRPQEHATHRGGESIYLQRGAPLAVSGGARTPTARGGHQNHNVCTVDHSADAVAAPASAASDSCRSGVPRAMTYRPQATLQDRASPRCMRTTSLANCRWARRSPGGPIH